MKVLFMGTGEIGVPTLRWLIDESGLEVVAVVCQPDRPVGRRQLLTPPATKVVAEAAGVRVLQPEKIGETAVVAALRALVPDVTVVMAYGQFLPKAVREVAPLGCLNLHASLLPRWRGASPIQSALAAGDAVTGVTVMHVDREMDAGDTILAESTPIAPDDTGQSLHDRLADLAPRALARALPLVTSGTAPRFPQDPAQVTHCTKLTRAGARMDWSRPAEELERLVRAYHAWPGTHTTLPASHGSRLLKVLPPTRVRAWPTEPDMEPSAPPGTLLAVDRDHLTIATGLHALTVSALQADGQKRLAARDFLAGTRLRVGDTLGNP